ncbi:MAG: ATP-binding cassette domain-containing protein [Candidatus Omnitrophica bacterium]|nr:ATP-binding cassette domain-containing protein [Candidatus Omnitrophota bacterium]
MAPIIEVTHLSKHYGRLRAVDDVSFHVEPGEIFGFLGPNGAGKTTTIHALCTLLQPTAGAATVAGYDVATRPHDVRRSIGIIFQDSSLDERLTAYENLNFHGILYHLPRAVRRQRIDEVLQLVDLAPRRHAIVKTFSGGMKRRLEMARGLLHHPKVLFLDEPTLGLDPQSRSHMWEYLRALRAREGITMFLTTHYMDEAEDCDRIAVIDHGKIIALDTPAGLKRQYGGGDRLTLRTEDDAATAEALQQRCRVSVERSEEGLRIALTNGHAGLPEVLAACPSKIVALDLHHPSLDDVFLRLTGRGMRDTDANELDQLRSFRKKWNLRT